MGFKDLATKQAYERARYAMNREAILAKRAANPGVKRAYYARNRDKLRKQLADWRAAHPEQHRATHRAYVADPAVKKKMAENSLRWRRSNPERAREINRQSNLKHKDRVLAHGKRIANTPGRLARTRLNYAIKRGKLPRAASLPCIRCGGVAREYHHHKGYAAEHWLSVVPACSVCHKQLDREASVKDPY